MAWYVAASPRGLSRACLTPFPDLGTLLHARRIPAGRAVRHALSTAIPPDPTQDSDAKYAAGRSQPMDSPIRPGGQRATADQPDPLRPAYASHHECPGAVAAGPARSRARSLCSLTASTGRRSRFLARHAASRCMQHQTPSPGTATDVISAACCRSRRPALEASSTCCWPARPARTHDGWNSSHGERLR